MASPSQQSQTQAHSHNMFHSPHLLDNSLHKQSSGHMNSGSRQSLPPSVNNTVTSVNSQSIPLMATSASLGVSPSQAATAVAVAADQEHADAINGGQDESADMTVNSGVDIDGQESNDGHDASMMDEDNTRRVNLSVNEKLLLVKTFVEHEREFFDANVRNRDFWIMINQKFSSIIDRPFKTARQAIYRYVKSAESEEKELAHANQQQGMNSGSSSMNPLAQTGLGMSNSPGARRRRDDPFYKYVARALAMFQNRKEMKEKRIKRSSSVIPGNQSLITSGNLRAIMGDNVGAEDYESIEQSIRQHHEAHGSMSPSPNSAGKNTARAMGLLESGALNLGNLPSSSSTPLSKRALNSADIYGARKKIKTEDAEYRLSYVEKENEALKEQIKFLKQEHHNFKNRAIQFMSTIATHLRLDDPFPENAFNTDNISESQTTGTGADENENAMIHPELTQQQLQQESEEAAQKQENKDHDDHEQQQQQQQQEQQQQQQQQHHYDHLDEQRRQHSNGGNDSRDQLSNNDLNSQQHNSNGMNDLDDKVNSTTSEVVEAAAAAAAAMAAEAAQAAEDANQSHPISNDEEMQEVNDR